MGISDKVQAAMVAVSGFLITLGLAAASLPAGIQEPTRTAIVLGCEIAGWSGLVIKEAAGVIWPDNPAPAKTCP